MTEYYAHSVQEEGVDWQKLSEHLFSVARLARKYAEEFNAGEMAYLAGLLHDLGKYALKFQERLHGSNEAVDHSTAGAKEIFTLAGAGAYEKIAAGLISYAIAGHHAGLADFSRLEERLHKTIEPLDDVWREDLQVAANIMWPGISLESGKEEIAFQLAFLGRMIFSCLVDADFKDTELFYATAEGRTVDREWPDLRESNGALVQRFNKFMDDIAGKASDNPVNRLRAKILTGVRENASLSTGVFTLTVPTGGGKTLASLGFALDHAKANNLRRIIYAIPFTSIIDQNAEIFKQVLGEDYILEHHSSIDDDKFKVREQKDKIRLAMEDWAAPVVVTTNVQLFESLFANRPGRCRKLHNISRSVIILDEAQTIPTELLRPCLAALRELARNYGSSIVLCTATQPAFEKLGLAGRELAPDPSELSVRLKRTTLSKGHVLDDDDITEEMRTHDQGLVIVNSRKHALQLYEKANKAGLEGVLHLTTRQHAHDRKEILKKVRSILQDNKPCRLIATSLVEAGVDLDFPRVWRAETGLDQIAQAAGRCNREGKRPVEESVVKIFKAKDNPPPKVLRQFAEDFSRMADDFIDDLLSPEAIKAYFEEVYYRKSKEQLDLKQILKEMSFSGGRLLLNFQEVSRKFQMIESGMTPVIINNGHSKVLEVIDRLQNPQASPGKAMRDLQTFIVQVPPQAATALRLKGRAEYVRQNLWGEQFLVMGDKSLYNADRGLLWEHATFQKAEDLIF